MSCVGSCNGSWLKLSRLFDLVLHFAICLNTEYYKSNIINYNALSKLPFCNCLHGTATMTMTIQATENCGIKQDGNDERLLQLRPCPLLESHVHVFDRSLPNHPADRGVTDTWLTNKAAIQCVGRGCPLHPCRGIGHFVFWHGYWQATDAGLAPKK